MCCWDRSARTFWEACKPSSQQFDCTGWRISVCCCQRTSCSRIMERICLFLDLRKGSGWSGRSVRIVELNRPWCTVLCKYLRTLGQVDARMLSEDIFRYTCCCSRTAMATLGTMLKCTSLWLDRPKLFLGMLQRILMLLNLQSKNTLELGQSGNLIRTFLSHYLCKSCSDSWPHRTLWPQQQNWYCCRWPHKIEFRYLCTARDWLDSLPHISESMGLCTSNFQPQKDKWECRGCYLRHQRYFDWLGILLCTVLKNHLRKCKDWDTNL